MKERQKNLKKDGKQNATNLKPGLILKAALSYKDKGLSIIPVTQKRKTPIISKWKRCQKEIPPKNIIKKWFSQQYSDLCVAIVCGKVSGNVEVLDFDVRGELFRPWKKAVAKRYPNLIKRLMVCRTQHGGYHVVYKCSDVTITGNSNLAVLRRKVDGKGQHGYKGKEFLAQKHNGEYFIHPKAIETRGEGGYFLCPPSPGYKALQGDLLKIPKITPKQRSFLIKTARSLNEWINPGDIERGYKTPRNKKGPKLPGEDFDERGNIIPILEKHGWKAVRKGNSKFQHYRRPGKGKGYSASLINNKIFYCFTTNGAPFDHDKAYGPFAVHALLEYNGDYKASAKALAKEGYGRPQKTSIQINEDDIQKKALKILESQKPTKTFQTSYLPSLLDEYIQQKCEETDAEPMMITQSTLCTLSAIIGKRCYFSEEEYFQRLYGNIWALIIGVSGTFKTTALNKGAKLAFRRREELKEKITVLEMRLDRISKNNEKRKKLEDRIAKLRYQNPILPEEATPEALLEYLSLSNGGMVMFSEFGQWINSMNRTYKLGFKNLLTNLYDVPGEIQILTKTSGLITVERPFITINAVSTLSWLEKNIKIEDVFTGFLARFLLFYPPQKETLPPALPQPRKRDSVIVNRLEKTIRLFDRKKVHKYSLSSNAARLYNSFHDKLYFDLWKQPEKNREIIEPFVKRWSPYVIKIAMLLQIIEHPKIHLIKAKSIKGACSIVDYAAKSTMYLFRNELGESEQQKKKKRVLEYIARRKGMVTRGQIIRSKILNGGVKEYNNVLETLKAEGSIGLDRSTGKEYEWKYFLRHK